MIYPLLNILSTNITTLKFQTQILLSNKLNLNMIPKWMTINLPSTTNASINLTNTYTTTQ